MNKDLHDRVITVVNSFIPELIDYYLEDNEKLIEEALKNGNKPQPVIDLVVTLKNWANPLGNYPVLLKPSDLINFKDLQTILQQPRKILSQEKNFTSDDEIESDKLVRIKLDRIADELIQKYDLKTEIDKQLQHDQTAVEKWWQNKSENEKLRIRQEYKNLSEVEKASLKKKMEHQPFTYTSAYSDPFLFNYFWMCQFRSYLIYDAFFHMADLFSNIYIPGSNIHTGDVHCDGCSSGSNDDGKAIGILAAIVGGITLISAGVMGGIYAAKKALNSLTNFFTGNKMLRSLYRLAGIGGGAYLGALEGGILGATFGSAIPGVGNAAGFIIGTIFGAGIGAGLGALLTKYSAKAISYLFHRNALNPTNPEKYQLTKTQIQNLRNKGHDLEVVDRMIRAIKREKSKIGISGSFPWTNARAEKNKLNALLDQVKQGQIAGPIKIGVLFYDPQLKRFDPDEKTTITRSSSTAHLLPSLNEKNIVPFPKYIVEPDAIEPSAPPLESAITMEINNEENNCTPAYQGRIL
jgi:hypothetical protein